MLSDHCRLLNATRLASKLFLAYRVLSQVRLGQHHRSRNRSGNSFANDADLETVQSNEFKAKTNSGKAAPQHGQQQGGAMQLKLSNAQRETFPRASRGAPKGDGLGGHGNLHGDTAEHFLGSSRSRSCGKTLSTLIS